MKVIIGADIVPTQSNMHFFSKGDVSGFIEDKLTEKLKEANFRIFNLETPLADSDSPIKKCGPSLIAPTSCVNGIKALGVDLFTLANNHIMDHGAAGLNRTIEVLKKNGIDFLGAGKNLSEAQKPYIIEKEEIKVGIYACAEHEFSIAEEDVPGANPFDPFESLDHIAKLKKECDHVIVLYHGGKEHYRYPSPYLRKVCRKICDKGADLVVCQHNHCVGCEEKYNTSTIVYGQGNFVFDKRRNEFWNSALLMEVSFNSEMEISYIPLEKKDGVVILANDDTILKNFCERSELIKQSGYIEKKYSEFSKKMFEGYIYTFTGPNMLFRIANKFFRHRLKKKMSEKRRLAMINYLQCEAHIELFINGLKGE